MSNLILELKDLEYHWEIHQYTSPGPHGSFYIKNKVTEKELTFKGLVEAISWALAKMGRDT